MPAVVVGHHGGGRVTNFSFARQLGFLKIGHADHVHAPTAVDVRFGFRRKLWPFHAEIGSAEFAHNARFLAGTFQNAGEFRADGICEGNVGDNAIAKKSIDAMARAVEELIGDDELHRLVLFLERADCGNGNNTLHSEMLKAINVRAKIQFGRKNAMPTPMPGQERDLSAFQRAENVGIRGLSERRAQADFFYFGKSRHGIESAAAYDSDFCLWQSASWEVLLTFVNRKLYKTSTRPYSTINVFAM